MCTVWKISYYGSNKVKGVVDDLLSVLLYVRTLRSVTHIHTSILLWIHYRYTIRSHPKHSAQLLVTVVLPWLPL